MMQLPTLSKETQRRSNGISKNVTMKTLFVLMICLISVISYGQDVKTEFDGHKWEAPYNLAIPKDWSIERFFNSN
jgi:hypothetical protein